MTVCSPQDKTKEISMQSPTKQEMGLSFEEEKEDAQRNLRERSDSLSAGSTGGGKGRILYCRKCEGHGKQSILKSHGPVCPYRFCKCSSCQRLDQKRLSSFNKRNKERLEMARELSQRKEQDRESDPEIEVLSIQANNVKADLTSTTVSSSPASSSGGTIEENISMSSAPTLGRALFAETSASAEFKTSPMSAAMSYEMWMAKTMAEKQRVKDIQQQIQGVDALRHHLSLPPFINLIPSVANPANSTPTTNSNGLSPRGQKRPADEVITIDDDSTTKKRPLIPAYQTIPMDVLPSTSGHSINTNTSATTMNGTPIRSFPNGNHRMAPSPMSPGRTFDGQRYVTLPTIPPISILVPNYVKSIEKSEPQQHHSAPPSVEPKTAGQTAEITAQTISPMKASSASNLPRMMAPFSSIPTTSSTMPTQVLPMFPIPAVTQQQQLHPQQHQLPPSYNFIPPHQQVSLQTATSVVSQSQSANDHQQQTVTTSAFPQNAQLLQIMQQHILQAQQQQQQQQHQQQRMIFAQAHQQKPPQQVIQAPQQADQGQLILQGQVSAQHANGGLSLGSTNQGPTLVTPAMLASMGINMAQVATMTPNGIQTIPGNMINLSQFQTIALAPTTQQTSANTPIFLSSIASQQPTQIQPPHTAQSTMTQLNHNQPMQLVVPSMALIEQMQQQRLLQQQAAAAAAASTTPTASTVPISTPLPVLQPQTQQTQQILGYVPKSQVSLSQLDQNQLAQMLMSSQAQVQANPTLVSMQAQANSANNANKMQLNQYMSQLQNLAILSQQGHPIMK